MGAHCFFPAVFLTPALSLQQVQFPAHQLTLSAALDRPCSKFELERARDLPLSRNAKGRKRLRKGKGREGRKWKGESENETEAEDNGRKVQLSCKRDRPDGEHAVVEDEGCAPRAGHTSVSFVRPARSVYLRANNRPHRGKTNSRSFSHRVKILYRAGARCKCGVGPIRRGFVPVLQLTVFVCDDEAPKIFSLCDDVKVMF